jgi:DnaJ-class molecular chaperone
MTREEWQKICAAGKLLGLGERATLKEIKKAYRAASKKHHPDTASLEKGKKGDTAMHEIIEAYEILQAYCINYKYPLVPSDNEDMEAEDWWMNRFGQDPLWSKK